MLPEGWKISTLGEISKVSSGGTPSRSNNAYWGGNIPWVTTAEVKFNTILDTEEKITKLGLEESSAKVYPIDTILMAMYGQGKTRGQVGILSIEATTNQACAAIVLKDNSDPNYYFQFLLSRYKHIRSLSNSGGQQNLSSEIVKSIQVPIPPFIEQKKIAQILSTWDKAIVTTEKLLENSQKRKQALMQQLLTGKKRFPEFNQNWISLKIGSLLKEVKRPIEWCDEQDYQLLSVKRRSEGIVLREVLKGHQILTKKMNLARKGDFLISKMQVVHGAMGLVTEVFDKHHISDSYIILAPKNKDSIDIHFFSWYCKQPLMYHKAYLCSYGVHIEKMTFNLKMFINEDICIPPTIEEQQKIAKVLSVADNEIDTLQDKLNHLKDEKKALMQQLLTGKRRVKVIQ